MKNQIHNLEINNFKSIRHLELDCKRINVLIGEPNVGKSNILEAISIFSAPFMQFNNAVFKDLIRFEKLSNLFYDQDRKNIISINTDIGSAGLRFHMNSINQYDFCLCPSKEALNGAFKIEGSMHSIQQEFDKYIKLNDFSGESIKPFYSPISNEKNFDFIRNVNYETPIKRYIFQPLYKHDSHFSLFLSPPFGDNLYTILESNPKLYDECSHFFTKYGLDLLIDTETNKLDVQKRVGNRVYKIPYALAADTLQRIIFHFAAIETNHDSILIFEEPEAHSFPKYISMFADKVIASTNNQFFIATHSPYLLTPFIEECDPKDIAIFICTYENYETKARALTDKEIGNIMENGIDMFYNIAAFENDSSK